MKAIIKSISVKGSRIRINPTKAISPLRNYRFRRVMKRIKGRGKSKHSTLKQSPMNTSQFLIKNFKEETVNDFDDMIPTGSIRNIFSYLCEEDNSTEDDDK